MEYIPYTYLIGWSSINKWYYGTEYGVKKQPCANPKNLWVTYFTSSKLVEEYRSIYGEPDVVQVRKQFNYGTIEERMKKSIYWEKRVLEKIDITDNCWLNGRIGGDICPDTLKKISLLKYGVENVFQSDEIKEKIKATNLKKYGVEHPSYSKELLQKKKDNNIKKYGVSCTLNLPHIRKKCNDSLQRDEVKEKRKNTNINLYGVEFPSQNEEVKEEVKKTREKLSNRFTVKLIREYNRVFKNKIGTGWYQSSDEILDNILLDLQNKFGKYSYEELCTMNPEKNYSSSIRKLQQRPIVLEIKKYKEKFGRKVSIGRCWDRKSEDELKIILEHLINTYGHL